MLNRSILVGMTLAYLVSLACGLLVANFLAKKSYNLYVAPTFEAMDRLELDEARSSFEKGGRESLAGYMERLNRAFGGKHYLLSADGTDLVSGVSRTQLLPTPPSRRYRGYAGGDFHLAQLSDDGEFWFAVFGTSNKTGPATWAYFVACILVTTALLLFSILYLVFPLRRIRDALSLFGNGQMDMRIASRRSDEIGQVAATFNGMAEQIEQSFRTERSLLQDISHELRAPLARLELAVHLAKREWSPQLGAQIQRNVKKLSVLVGEITAFHQRWSAVETAKPLETVDLAKLLRSVTSDAKLEANSRSIQIHLDSVPVTLYNARPDLIERVLENVLRNAITHSPVGSRIEVDMAHNATEAIIVVRDFGNGVAPEHLEHIFDPFYQEPGSQNERIGLGLGLSIARRGVQWHGGRLQAENATPGLRLTATLPMNSRATPPSG
jgi:signal transduction histidine kinase